LMLFFRRVHPCFVVGPPPGGGGGGKKPADLGKTGNRPDFFCLFFVFSHSFFFFHTFLFPVGTPPPHPKPENQGKTPRGKQAIGKKGGGPGFFLGALAEPRRGGKRDNQLPPPGKKTQNFVWVATRQVFGGEFLWGGPNGQARGRPPTGVFSPVSGGGPRHTKKDLSSPPPEGEFGDPQGPLFFWGGLAPPPRFFFPQLVFSRGRGGGGGGGGGGGKGPPPPEPQFVFFVFYFFLVCFFFCIVFWFLVLFV